MNGLKDEQFSEIRKSLTKDAGYILHALNSESGHLGDVISGLKTTVSSIELKIETLKKTFNDFKKKRIMKTKLYFQDIDSTFCHPLEDHIKEAKEEGLTSITLVEAIPDDGTSGHIWCMHYGDTVERHECKKAYCSSYSSKSGRGVCENRGDLYLHGEKVEFKID